MAIVDNRTLLDNADAVTNWDSISGAASGTQSIDTFIQGTACVGVKLSATTNGLLFDAGSAQNWSNNHFYFWWNVLTAGLLDTQAGGGVRMRFCGATVTDFFEVYIAGKDTYTGGFIMSVVDIETAAASPSGTGGTPPATSAIRYVGIVFDVPGMLGGNFLNCLVDACWRLPASTPGIRVEGQNSGPVDWTWGDIVSAADVSDATKAWGTAFRRNGVIFINTPIRFGANDATTHGFSDTNEVIAWEDHSVASTFYSLEIIGGSGAQSFSLGTRVGSGDTSIGHSGCVFTAASAGDRFNITASDANIDVCEFLGCTFSHTGTIDISNVNSEIRSTLLSDGSATTHADAGGDGVFQKNTIVGANTADGVAYVTTDDPSDIKNTAFVFSDGHAIVLTATGTFAFEGNTFSGYGATGTNDAAIYNNSGGSVTINITGGGDTPTYRNGAGASTTINNNITVTVTVKNQGGTAVPGVEVAIFQDNAARTVVLASTPTDENGEVTTSAAASLGAIIIRARQSTNIMSFLTSESTTDGVNSTLEEISNPTLHNFQTGDAVVYGKNGGSASISASITDGGTYYVRAVDTTSVKLYASAANAISDTSAFNLLASGSETHKLDPSRFVAGSATGTIGTGDFSAQITLVTDNIATG